MLVLFDEETKSEKRTKYTNFILKAFKICFIKCKFQFIFTRLTNQWLGFEYINLDFVTSLMRQIQELNQTAELCLSLANPHMCKIIDVDSPSKIYTQNVGYNGFAERINWSTMKYNFVERDQYGKHNENESKVLP